MFSVVYRVGFAIVVAAVAGAMLLSPVYLRAQTTTPGLHQLSAKDPFGTYDKALGSAADGLLAIASERPAGRDGNSSGTELESQNAAGGRDEGRRLKQAISRVQQFRPVLEPILRNEGVPAGLAAVVLVESGGQVTALSPKGARGIWQFMPDTARRYGLIVTPELDERLDVYKSTRAAARYLRDLHTQFESWPLALAAYNAGEDTVQRAIDRTSTRDFASVARMLPLETRSYVPAVLNAVAFIAGSQEGLTSAAAPSAKRATVYALAQMD